MQQLQALSSLLTGIRQVIAQARQGVYRAANAAMVRTYWEVGRLIVEDEQEGERRAEYGKQAMKELARQLTAEFGAGFTETNLKYMRLFYQAFPIRHALRDELGWTHYRSLLRVQNPEAREWYMHETVAAGWSSRALDRQIGTLYYERHLRTPKPDIVRAEAEEKTAPLADDPRLFLKSPYVLEFLGLTPETDFSERDLEKGIIAHLQKFLLEMGRGFAFVARQQHIRTEHSDYFIDLVFYHTRLKCYVILDLKVGALTHQDIGQIDMYRRIYDDLHRAPDDKPTIGIILCSEKSATEVRYSTLADTPQLFATEYLPFLPREEELKALIEQDRALFEELSNE